MTTPITRTILTFALPALMLAAAQHAPAQAEDFQQYLQGACNGTLCTVDFDKIPAGKRLRVTNTSCYVRINSGDTSPYDVIRALQLLLVKRNGTVDMAATLPAEIISVRQSPGSAVGVYHANEPLRMTGTGGQHMRSYVELFEGTFEQVACHISGTLS